MSEPLSRIPSGMRYYFGSEARLRRKIEETAMAVFDGWSYQEITTPTVDYYSLFESGMGAAEAHRAFRFTDVDGSLLALRPDVTSATARAAATLFADSERPLRLCYAAPVFRQQSQSHAEWRRESTQIGCELIGANTHIADLEVLAIASEFLTKLSLAGDYCITLNDVGIFNGVANRLNLDHALREELSRLIDLRNSADLEHFFSRYTSTSEGRAFAQLAQLSGRRETLQRAREVIANGESQAALTRMEKLWAVIESLDLTDRFEIDLGDVARLGYYTGLTFKIYVNGAGGRVGSGGRYDGLTASFGRTEPAVGFVLDLDALTDVLRVRSVNETLVDSIESKTVEPSDADSLMLFRETLKLRALGQRVLLNLGESTNG
jgi:ATP phosphoribosyltransferase regulatory subunit